MSLVCGEFYSFINIRSISYSLINLGGFSFFGRKLTILPMVFFIFLILTPLIATLPEPVSAITFAPTQNLSNNQGDSINPQVAVSGVNVYVAWEENNNLLFRRSTNDGINFDSITILSNTGGVHSPNIVKSGSNVYVVWDDVNGIFLEEVQMMEPVGKLLCV